MKTQHSLDQIYNIQSVPTTYAFKISLFQIFLHQFLKRQLSNNTTYLVSTIRNFKMDQILIRFPVVCRDIFKHLDEESLVKCKRVEKNWHKFLENNSLLWRRRIQKYSKYLARFSKQWKMVTNKVSINNLKKIAFAVEKFFKSYPKKVKCPENSPRAQLVLVPIKSGDFKSSFIIL